MILILILILIITITTCIGDAKDIKRLEATEQKGLKRFQEFLLLRIHSNNRVLRRKNRKLVAIYQSSDVKLNPLIVDFIYLQKYSTPKQSFIRSRMTHTVIIILH